MDPLVVPLPDLLGSLCSVSQSMRGALDPRRFLEAFSERLQPLVPHDRLVVDVLEEDGRAFTVFAEYVVRGPRLHEAHYTAALDRERYLVADWVIRPVFSGEPVRIDDVASDARYVEGNPYERQLVAAGVRAALAAPLISGGGVIGALVATSITPGVYTTGHLAALARVAEVTGPLVDSAVLLERERRRRRRLRAVHDLSPVLGASLDVRDTFAKLADGLRPILDFDVMGACLISATGRELEMIAEVNDLRPAPARIPLADFSFAPRVEAGRSS